MSSLQLSQGGATRRTLFRRLRPPAPLSELHLALAFAATCTDEVRLQQQSSRSAPGTAEASSVFCYQGHPVHVLSAAV